MRRRGKKVCPPACLRRQGLSTTVAGDFFISPVARYEKSFRALDASNPPVGGNLLACAPCVCAHQDSNLEPQRYKLCALPLSYGHVVFFIFPREAQVKVYFHLRRATEIRNAVAFLISNTLSGALQGNKKQKTATD